MSFSPEEIVTMLADYENDHHTGMDIQGVSKELHFYTGGYPFLVSRLCKTIDEKEGYSWDGSGLRKAVRILLMSKNTLFDDLSKNCENNAMLDAMISDILLSKKEYPFSHMDPVVDLGHMFGIFKESGGKVAISNVIFELALYERALAKFNANHRTAIAESSQFVTMQRDTCVVTKPVSRYSKS